MQTSLTMQALSGSKGEFLLVRLPVGDYELSVQEMGIELTLAGTVAVEVSEVTEVVARVQPGGNVSSALPKVPQISESDVAEPDLADLPVNGGQWASLALTVAGGNAASTDDSNAANVSFRGVALTENNSRSDGVSSDQNFSGAASGTGVF